MRLGFGAVAGVLTLGEVFYGTISCSGKVGGGVGAPVIEAGTPSSGECSVGTTQKGPFPVVFSFENRSGTTLGVSLGGDCGARYEITSCADGYRRALVLHAPCGALCPMIASCSDGACLQQTEPVTAAAPLMDLWEGYDHVAPKGSSIDCVDEVTAPAGRYRVSVPVYDSPTDPNEGAPLYTAVVDFTLPVPGGVVHVPVDRELRDAGPPSSEGGRHDASKDAATCAPVVARRYDVARDCYGPKQMLPGVCLTDFETGQLGDMECAVAPDGTRYAFVKHVTECLDPAALLAGWRARGGPLNACLTVDDIDERGKDGELVDDACSKAAYRGEWATDGLGTPSLDFDSSDGSPCLLPTGRACARECPDEDAGG